MNLVFIYKTIKLENYISKTKTTRSNKHYFVSKNLIFYPIIGLLFGLPRTINRLKFFSDTYYLIILIQTFCDSVQGFVYVTLYLFSYKPYRRDIINFFKKKKNINNLSAVLIQTGENENSTSDLQNSNTTFVFVTEEHGSNL